MIVTKAEQYFIKTTKAAIERYKRRANDSNRPPFEQEAYSVAMYDNMETLKEVQKLIDAAECD